MFENMMQYLVITDDCDVIYL